MELPRESLLEFEISRAYARIRAPPRSRVRETGSSMNGLHNDQDMMVRRDI